MKLKVLCLMVVALSQIGCSRFFIKKESYTQVKKAALVHYALNPRLFFGTTQSDEARAQSAEANVKAFLERMNGTFTYLTLDELKANPGYQAMGQEKIEHYYTAPGVRFLVDDPRLNERGELPPEVAKAACEKLGVDAVVAVADSWNLAPYALGFRTKIVSTLWLNMYDKIGERIWGDVANGESEEGMAYTAGVVSTDVATVVLNSKQAVAAALEPIKAKAAQ
jgi:hypothetical protein